MLFLDEFDAIAKKDDSNDLEELKRVVTTFFKIWMECQPMFSL